MPTAAIRNDLELAYTLTGPPEAPVLMLITGLGGLKEGWFRQKELSDTFRLLAWDHRGMGGSTVVDAPTTMADLAEDAVRLLDVLGIATAHAWGVSMGGKVAQELALGWPDRVDRLILENTSAGEAHRPDRAPSPLRDGDRASEEDWLGTIVPLLFGPAYREANAGSMRAFARSRVRSPPDARAFRRQWEAYDAFDSWDRLPGLRHRTLVLVGALDALCDPENGALLAARIPDATLHVVADGGHSVHIECPDEVNAAVRAFLA